MVFVHVYFSNETVFLTTAMIGPMKMFYLEHETTKQTFIVWSSKWSIFIVPVIFCENCLVWKMNIRGKNIHCSPRLNVNGSIYACMPNSPKWPNFPEVTILGSIRWETVTEVVLYCGAVCFFNFTQFVILENLSTLDLADYQEWKG